jgi:hypothetical protein
MNKDELKALITTLIWTDLNASERVLSRRQSGVRIPVPPLVWLDPNRSTTLT